MIDRSRALARILGLSMGLALLLAAPAMAEPAAPGAFADVAGGKLYYETCGSGPRALVLIHDGLVHAVGFDAAWPMLCARYRVVRYDRRGYGRSPAASAPYAPTEDLAAVMAAAKVDHAVLVGASSGGGLAVDFALAHPQAVDGLVLVGADVSGFPYSKHFVDKVNAAFAPLRFGDAKGALANITGPSSYLFAPGHPAERQQLAEILMANHQNITHRDPATRAPVARPLLTGLKTPTLILTGEFDDAENQARAGALEALIPGASRVIINDGGHLVYMEHPREFSDLVTGFVDKLGR